MKVLSLWEAVSRYGQISFEKAVWPDKSKWMRFLNIPSDWFPNWKVLNTQESVRVIYCNIDIRDALYGALQSVHDLGLGHVLKTFDGCFNIRLVRGSDIVPSAHSYGLALDINAGDNPLKRLTGGFYDTPQFVKCFTDQGFDWGGNFKNRKDPMHFSYCWEHN